MIHIFQAKNRRRFVILVGQSFFGTSKFHENSWIFCIKISIVQKKVDKKTTFPKSPICHWTSIFRIFEKNQFFWIFLFKFTLLKKRWFFVVFFENFFTTRFVILVGQSFFDFSGFFVKNVLSIEREVFFFFVKKKTSNWTPVWGGGGKKSSFFKINFLDY